jgi:CO/xanthine dehydrogenase Mo-binding subunit
MRAPGGAQAVQAIECHMDLCAREMGIDPLEIRLMNTITEPHHTGSPRKAREALRAAAQAIAWDVPKPEGVGRGIAMVEVHNSQADGYTARLIVKPDGEVVLHTPIIEQGAGMLTTFRLLTAEQFGVPPDQVRIEQTMEDFVYDRGVGGSRATRIVGKMIGMLGERMRTRLGDLVAEASGYDPPRVAFEPGGFRTPDGRLHSLAEAASLAGGDVAELIEYEPTTSDTVEVYAAIASEVEVDRATGQVRVQRAAIGLETGRIVNPVMYQGQIDGGLAQGLGYALMEGLAFDEGRVAQLNLHEYKIPTVADIPPLQTALLPPDAGLGTTAIGEGPNCAMAPSIVNAIVDVVGHQIDIPVSAEAVLEALEADSPTRPF